MTEVQNTRPLDGRVSSILDHSLKHGGGTFTPSGQPVTSGIAVTVTIIGTVAELSTESITAALKQTEGEQLYLGTWYDPEFEQWELSETVVFDRLIDARRIGIVLNERYVYDIDRGVTLSTS